MSKKKLNQQVYDVLNPMFKDGFGKSRHIDKKTGADKNRIYSRNTYKTYMRECRSFCAWCREKYECKTLADCMIHIEEYIHSQSEKSAWTVSTKAAAICKMYQIQMKDLGIELPKRHREDIERSRVEVEYDKHISAETRETYGSITRCIGCRIRELKALCGTDLIEKDGRYYVCIKNGKGGKMRYAPIIGSDDEISKVVRMFRDAGSKKVFSSIPRALDNHDFRAEYATRLYHMIARDIETIDRSERYYCRKDKAGVVYDKCAMSYVSRALGHNRISVIAESYLRY